MVGANTSAKSIFVIANADTYVKSASISTSVKNTVSDAIVIINSLKK